VTQAFVAASAGLRLSLGIDDACFARKSVKLLQDEAASAQLPLL
jgi:hypothetical protein